MPDDKIYFKMELKKGSGGNMIVVVRFNPDARNFGKNDFSRCPTLDELNVLEQTKEFMEK